MHNIKDRGRDDLDTLAQTTTSFLQKSETLHTMNPFQLVHLSMMLGYYYAVMRKNYVVEVIHDSAIDKGSNEG
jgi:hypothetical protein